MTHAKPTIKTRSLFAAREKLASRVDRLLDEPSHEDETLHHHRQLLLLEKAITEGEWAQACAILVSVEARHTWKHANAWAALIDHATRYPQETELVRGIVESLPRLRVGIITGDGFHTRLVASLTTFLRSKPDLDQDMIDNVFGRVLAWDHEFAHTMLEAGLVPSPGAWITELNRHSAGLTPLLPLYEAAVLKRSMAAERPSHAAASIPTGGL